MDSRVVDINSVESWKENPREALDLEELKDSLLKYGQFMPLLLDGRDMKTIIGGNMRLRAMGEMNWKEIWVSVVFPKSDEEMVELAILSNRSFGKYIKKQLIAMREKYPIIGTHKINLNERKIDQLDIKESVHGESEFGAELLEENNYVVFFFNNKLDWEFVRKQLGIETVKSIDSEKGYDREGVNRVLDGKILVGLIQK